MLDPRNENGKRPLNAAHYSTWLDLPKGTEDMPSPSTEFAKLDLSLSNPFFGIPRKNTSNIPKTPKNEQKDNTLGNTNVSNPMFDLPSLAGREIHIVHHCTNFELGKVATRIIAWVLYKYRFSICTFGFNYFIIQCQCLIIFNIAKVTNINNITSRSGFSKQIR